MPHVTFPNSYILLIYMISSHQAASSFECTFKTKPNSARTCGDDIGLIEVGDVDADGGAEVGEREGGERRLELSGRLHAKTGNGDKSALIQPADWNSHGLILVGMLCP